MTLDPANSEDVRRFVEEAVRAGTGCSQQTMVEIQRQPRMAVLFTFVFPVIEEQS